MLRQGYASGGALTVRHPALLCGEFVVDIGLPIRRPKVDLIGRGLLGLSTTTC
jgi:hypothetical protein